MASDSADSLTFRVSHAAATDEKKGLGRFLTRRKDETVEIKLGYDDIVQRIKDQDDREVQGTAQAPSTKVDPRSAKIPVSKGSCTVWLEVVGGDVDGV